MQNETMKAKSGTDFMLKSGQRIINQSEEWEAVKMNILEIGIEKGKEQGIEQGIEQSRTEIIRNMLKNGLSSEKIAELTQISLDIIKEVEKA